MTKTMQRISRSFLIQFPKTSSNKRTLQGFSVIKIIIPVELCVVKPGASAKLTFDCDKCDCIEYLPPAGRLARALITETDFDELFRSADKICNPRAGEVD